MLSRILIVMQLCICLSLYAQTTDSSAIQFQEDSTQVVEKEPHQSWAVLPVIISSEETSWSFGAFVAYFFEQKDTTINASSIEAAGYYTLKNQLNLSASPDFYWGPYHLETYLYYEIWPANYYGVGMGGTDDSTSFDAKNLGVDLMFEQKLHSKLYAGLAYKMAYEDITPDEQSSILTTPGTVGGRGALTSGLGLVATYDNKNHQYWATSGEHVKLETYGFHKAIGSEYGFFKYRLKAKKYFSVGEGGIATMFYNEVNYGDSIPFRQLATPDGVYEMRGVENGRYRDNNLITIGAEYRRELWWRLGMVAFSEAFQSWGQQTDFQLSETLVSVGGGVRFALNPEKKFNVRADLAWVQKNGIGLTVYVREAF